MYITYHSCVNLVYGYTSLIDSARCDSGLHLMYALVCLVMCFCIISHARAFDMMVFCSVFCFPYVMLVFGSCSLFYRSYVLSVNLCVPVMKLLSFEIPTICIYKSEFMCDGQIGQVVLFILFDDCTVTTYGDLSTSKCEVPLY